MGDSAYFQGMSNYANDPAVKHKSAVISDFKEHMSAVHGSDLTWFFDEWIYQPNHPVYANNYWITTLTPGVWQVGFVAKQTQSNTPFHKMPVEVRITFSTGPDTLVRVMNDVNNQIYMWNFTRQPSTVTFDPGNNIVIKQATLSQIPPLPVELSAFNATVKENFVTLVWTTASELNNSGFEVQRKSNSGSWEKISFVEGKGTTNLGTEYSYLDYLHTYGTYIYRLKQIDLDGSFSYSNEITVQAGLKPDVYNLSQNYPNPFNPVTTIDYQLPMNGFVTLEVYDLLGNRIASLVNEEKASGNYSVRFDAAALSSGVYFYKLSAGNFSAVKKLTVVK
jgi:hypothetical protein